MSEPTITSKNVPQPPPPAVTPSLTPPPPAPIAGQVPYDQIVAKPLRPPNFINLKAKNPNMTLYWGNRSVGEKESGRRYDELVAMGFQPAKPDDVVKLPPSLVRDGRIMFGDLILMVIPRADYVGATKWNEQTAQQRVRRFGQTMDGGASAHQTLTGDGREQPGVAFAGISANPRLRSKVQPYVPPLAGIEEGTNVAVK